jgi:hypothetical protein
MYLYGLLYYAPLGLEHASALVKGQVETSEYLCYSVLARYGRGVAKLVALVAPLSFSDNLPTNYPSR